MIPILLTQLVTFNLLSYWSNCLLRCEYEANRSSLQVSTGPVLSIPACLLEWPVRRDALSAFPPKHRNSFFPLAYHSSSCSFLACSASPSQRLVCLPRPAVSSRMSFASRHHLGT